MPIWNSSVWGPQPRYAIGPLLLVFGILSWVGYENPRPMESPAATTMTVMKPVEGTAIAPPAGDLPMEILYGVPTSDTKHLWPGPHEQTN